MVDRTEVSGLQQIQSNAIRSPNVINRQTKAADPASSISRVSNILNALSGFVDVSSEVAFKQAQIEVENKKITGMSTALTGGKLGEEATKAESMGFDLVQSQTELLKVNDSLARTIQENPEMSDDDLNAIKSHSYGELLAKYQDKDKDVFKALSVKAQESQMTLAGVQKAAQKQYRDFKAEEDLQYNIGAGIDAVRSVEQGTQFIHQILSQGKAAGLREDVVKNTIFDQMKLQASQGDNRLLKFVQATDWGKYTKDSKQASALYSSYIKQAQSEYEAAQQRQNVFAYGQGLAEVERLAKSGASDEEIKGGLQRLQSMGMQFSPSTVASYLTMGKTVSATQQELSNNVNIWQSDIASFSLAQNPRIAASDKPKVLEAAESAIVNQAQNEPEETRGDFVIQNLFGLAKQTNMPVKTVSTALSSLANIDPQMPISDSVKTWTKYLLSADDQTIRMHVGEKDQKMLFGMRDVLINSQGADFEQALKTSISRGQMVRDNDIPMTPQQTRTIQSKSASVTKDFDDPTLTTFYFTTKGLPAQSRDFVTNQIAARAKNLYPITGDASRAVDLATKEYKDNNMVLTGGIMANIGINQLAAQVPELAASGDDSTVLQKRAVSALDYKVGNIITSQSKVDDIKYQSGDARVIFSNSGETYQINVGGLVVGTYFTKDLKGEYNEEFYKRWDSKQEEQQVKSRTYRSIEESKEMAREINPTLIYN